MLENYFNYKQHKTSFKTEVIAGVTTFLTMAYIMFLNPFILSGEFAGPEKGFFDFGAVFTATIVATALACFIMAFYGKTWPIGLAPGMGINAFVAFGVVGGMGYTPQAALGAVLVAGVLFLIISLTPIRAWLINSIPKSLKLGIGAGIGLFLAIIGLEIMGVVADHPVTLVTIGDMKNPLIILACLAFVSMIVMEKLNVKGNIIIGIIVFSIIAWASGLAKFNGVVGSIPPMTYLFDFDLRAALTAGMSTVIFTLLFIDFFDTAGTLTSVANVAGKVDSKGKVQDIEKAMMADSVGSVAGALMGTTTVTSMDVNYTIDGGATITESLSGLSLATGDYYDFNHGTTWSPTAGGVYVIAVWATNLNGASDMNTANDMVSGPVTVYDNATIRRPMLESFTSSTCGPCVPGNVNVVIP